MKILVLGASGLIGSHVLHALQYTDGGMQAIGASRCRPAGVDAANWRELDFGAMTAVDDWLPQLQDVDAVINCVGIIRESRPGDFERLHQQAPQALFSTCRQAGVRRVIQISALGSDANADTAYWRSKAAADDTLLAMCKDSAHYLQGTVLRPSLVYGDEGASSRLLRSLATLPLVIMPMARRALVQPMHINDLTALVISLLRQPSMPPLLAAVGPRPLTIAAYLQALRHGMAVGPGLTIEMPAVLARPLARCAAWHTSDTFTPASLRMLEQSADGSNTADPTPVQQLLRRPLRDPADFARPQLRVAATLAWGLPLCHLAIAVLWLLTAYVSWFGWPHADSLYWLAQCGAPATWRTPMLACASLLDAAIGIAVLLYGRRWNWLWPAQLALVLGYSIVMTLCLPTFWLHPFGPLSKNLPIAALMLVLWRANARQEAHH